MIRTRLFRASGRYNRVVASPDVEQREAAARAISDAVRRARRPWPRSLWLTALVVSAACLIGLAVAWLQDRHTVAEHPLERRAAAHESGFGFGLLVGAGIGIAVAGVALARKRESAPEAAESHSRGDSGD